MAKGGTVGVTRLFFIVFSLAFGWVFLVATFANMEYPRSALASAGLAVVFGAVLVGAAWLLRRHAAFCARYGWLLCTGVMVFTAAFQLVNGYAMRFSPAYDLEAIYGGGIYWSGNDDMAQNEWYMTYFHRLPINMGGLFFFRCLFGLCRLLGVTDFFAAALWCNTLLLQATLLCSYAVLRRMAGPSTAAFLPVVFLLFPPFYMMGAVFYTDALSMLFPMLCLLLYEVARHRASPLHKTLLYAAAGLCAGVGAVIKFTTLVMLVAVLIATFISRPHPRKATFVKATLLPCLAAVLAAGAVLALFNGPVRGSVLNKERLEQDSLPTTHWIAMGLLGSGGYDEADFDRMFRLPNKAAREEAAAGLIYTRLTEPGVIDLAALATRKAVKCFGDGTYDLAIFLDDNPHQRAAVHEWVLFDGQHYALYSHLCQGVYLALLGLALWAGVQAALSPRRGWRAMRHPAPFIAFFGLLLFLLMWETNSRYTLNFMPVLFTCAAIGAASIPLPRRGKGGQKTPAAQP